ncbi:dioxygenase family protein [Algoriphagus halophilus]|uniref:Dioxygenase n=1 Tax=Algoriphagus halophilus TaxID=226505 RepID=A0A1N6G0F8_9BACT|nr:catechol 1,2-dioxygenase [Algoriphagus halophilus]SIO01008.1 Dioxygenase [Algoriphagus halophilus]
MKRRKFIEASALSVVAISSFGFIRFDGKKYVGDCETTTDILGPFYRPDSPMRSNLNISGSKGKPIHLTGIILNEDCTTPYANAKVELWHCDHEGVYDNSTPAYNYRGTVMTDSKGQYAFDTILPVPYDAGGGLIRPAHYHMMVTAAGYQTLVTQLYFSGDENIKKDPWASNDAAKNRVLEISPDGRNGNIVTYHVGLSKKLNVEEASLEKLTGTYTAENGDDSLELFQKEGRLWQKNEVFGIVYDYLGNNTFEFPGLHDGSYRRLIFQNGVLKQEMFQPGSEVKSRSFTKIS